MSRGRKHKRQDRAKRFAHGGACLVSVIIPVYNTEKYLRACLDSIVGQTLENIEIICVNDGSTDQSLDILNEYARKDRRISVINKTNAGLGAARNDGLGRARGKYVHFMDSDDVLEHCALQKLSERMEKDQLDQIIFSAEVFSEDSTCEDDQIKAFEDYYEPLLTVCESIMTGAEFVAKILREGHLVVSAPLRMLRRKMLERETIRFPEGIFHEDEVFTPLSLLAAHRLVSVQDRHYHRRVRGGSITIGLDTRQTGRRTAHICIALLKLQNALRNRDVRLGRMLVSRLRRACQKRVEELTKDGVEAFRGECERLVGEEGLQQIERALSTRVVNANPRISVIVPVYNPGDCLAQCMDSILSQSFGNIEVICVDDGSTDGSLEALREYEAKDDRVFVLTQPNSGAGVARNKGLRFAWGKYVDFVDPDDFLSPGMLGDLYAKAERTNAEIVVSGVFRYDSDAKKVIRVDSFGQKVNRQPEVFSGADVADQALTAFLPAPWNKFIRLDFIQAHDLEFQALPRCNDVRFTLTSLALASRITVLDKPLYCYRQGRAGSLQNTSNDDPTLVLKAYLGLKTQLVTRGVFERHAKNFQIALSSSCLYTIGLLSQERSVGVFFTALRSGEYSDLLSPRLEAEDFGNLRTEFLRYNNLLDAKSPVEFLLRETALLKQANVRRNVASNTWPGPSGLHAVDSIIELLDTWRIDVKCDPGVDCEIKGERIKVSRAGWHKECNGYVVEGRSGKVTITIVCHGTGAIHLHLICHNTSHKGVSAPFSMDYGSVEINGTQMLNSPFSASYEHGKWIQFPVTEGDVLSLKTMIRRHKYTGVELLKLLTGLCSMKGLKGFSPELLAGSPEMRDFRKNETFDCAFIANAGQKIAQLEEKVHEHQTARVKNWQERMKFAQRLKELEVEIARIKSSKSYRIGRFLTWPVRKIRRMFSKKS